MEEDNTHLSRIKLFHHPIAKNYKFSVILSRTMWEKEHILPKRFYGNSLEEVVGKAILAKSNELRIKIDVPDKIVKEALCIMKEKIK